MLKVLLVAPWVPWPPHDGARIRILHTLRHLSGRHQVTLAAPVRNARDAAGLARLRGWCHQMVTAPLPDHPWRAAARVVAGAFRLRPAIESVHWSPALAAAIRRLTAAIAYDIVQVELSLFAAYVGAVDPSCRARTVLALHNVESLRFARELGRRSTLTRRAAIGWDRLVAPTWEARAVAAFHGVTAVSDLERRWVERAAPGAAVTLAPNGVDTEHFRPRPAPPAAPSVVFTGAMNYPPNVDAVTWFCDTTWPILRRQCPDLRFRIVGRTPDPRVRALGGRDGVAVTGEVADVRPYLAEASAVVVPLRSGGGTRLKILEALAMGRPVVSTMLGAEGLEATDGRHLLLADTPEQLTRAVLSVLRSPELARRLGAAGRRLAVERYDWSRCLAPLDGLYASLLAGAPPAVPAEARFERRLRRP